MPDWSEKEVVERFEKDLDEIVEAARGYYENLLLSSVDEMYYKPPDDVEPPHWLTVMWEVDAMGTQVWDGGWFDQPHILTKLFNAFRNVRNEIEVIRANLLAQKEASHG